MAVLNSGELAMERAIRSADFSLAAPSTSMVISLRAPSPSRTIWRASDSSTPVSAAAKALAEGFTPEAPLARTATVSLVEVSPSTEIRL
jgi:hypothetical protein